MAKDTRREFIHRALALSTIGTLGPLRLAEASGNTGFRRISTEETFGVEEVYDATAALIRRGGHQEPALDLPPKDSSLTRQLFDLGDRRLADMDRAGIDLQVMSLWSPGVQIFEAAEAKELAAHVNDTLAGAIRKHPNRFAGLITVAPQDPEAAAREIDRGRTSLGLHGVVINSYTKGEFLDDRKFWAIFEAAEAHGLAIYLHPRTPPAAMYEPFSQYGMDGALWGFHAESSTHAVRLLRSGVFDQFPDLKIVLGHMGEGLPFWLNRLDTIASRPGLDSTRRRPSEYFLNNFVITTSGMFWDPILTLSHTVLGADRILFGVDYPFAPNAAGVRWLDAAPLSTEDKRKIYSDNAVRVFHLS